MHAWPVLLCCPRVICFTFAYSLKMRNRMCLIQCGPPPLRWLYSPVIGTVRRKTFANNNFCKFYK